MYMHNGCLFPTIFVNTCLILVLFFIPGISIIFISPQLAYQQLLGGKIIESLATYKKAFSADETSVAALAGVIHCQLINGQVDEAEQQLEFLAEVRNLFSSLS